MKSMVMVAAAALCCAAFAQGQERGPREGVRRGGFRDGGMPMMDPVVRVATNPKVAEKLGLSEEQKTKLSALVGDIAANRESQKKVRDAVEKQIKLMNAEKIDEAAVMKAIDEVFDLRREMAKEQAKRVIAVKSVLTPEQLAKAREEIARPRGPRGERGARRGKGPHDGDKGPGPKPEGE